MVVSKDKWVKINYTVKEENGTFVDSSEGKEPLGYLHGNGNLIAALESDLEGKSAGYKFDVTCAPKDAYGEYYDSLCSVVDKELLGTDEVTLGMNFRGSMENGNTILLRVTKIDGDKITLDGNHELAGKTLRFTGEIVEVREPTEEELNPPSCCGGCGGNCGETCDEGCGNCCN